ncbi:hypothetical protein CEXT_635851 [Caerostris extrusa]|uniref:Secreted protein n=1 Tax=Caerostris extrusa TaxID=172846 RepID=A0AAV4N206_CAEEX|nr:hypothetical protein CEXT_635851 [Caerostris extrusa]
MEDRKRKESCAEADLCMFLFSAAAAAHTFFHFLCDAGSEIGIVLPKPQKRKFSAPIPLALKSLIIFNGHQFARTVCYLILCITS